MQPRAGAAGQEDPLHAAVPNRWPGIAPRRAPPATSRDAPGTSRWCAPALPRNRAARSRPAPPRFATDRSRSGNRGPGRSVTKWISRSRGPAGSGSRRSRCGADRAHHVEVAARLAGADRVGGARLALLQHAHQRGGVVLDEDPVAPVGAVAVDRQRLALQRVQRDQRDQLLRELPRAVVVGGVGDDGRQPVGVEPGAHQMVGRRLARRIGAARVVRAWSRRTARRPGRARRTPRRWRCDGSGRPRAAPASASAW